MGIENRVREKLERKQEKKFVYPKKNCCLDVLLSLLSRFWLSLLSKSELPVRFRSIFCGQCRGRTRRIPAWRSTFAGRWKEKPRWSLRSRRSTFSREER